MTSVARPSLRSIAMQTAQLWATRSVCTRLSVGAVIVDRYWSVVASGYNSPPRGRPHDERRWLAAGGCTACVHAEANAIYSAARRGAGIEGMTLVSTHQPCLPCAQAIVQTGLARAVYGHPYRLPDGLDLLAVAGVEILQHDMEV